eukprot:509925_1
MINTWFIVFSSITLRQVVSYECPSGKDIQTGPACRLSEAQLDSFGNDKAFAQAYAMRLCEDMVNFYKNGATWEHAFGELGESVYSETTEGHVDTQRSDVGYNNFKVDAMFSRNVAEPPEINCEEAVYNDKSKFLDRHIKLKVKAKSGFKGVAAKDIMFFKQYFFESDGTLRKVQYQSLSSGTQMRDFVTAATTAAKAAISSAEFIGIIEEQVEGSERNIELLTKLVFIILGVFCAMIAAVVAYGVKLCLSSSDTKQRVKYDAVPQIAVE